MKLISSIVILFAFAANTFGQTSSEFDMVNEINLVRTNPKEYKECVIDFIKNHPSFKSTASDELLSFLDTVKSLNPLIFNCDIYKAIGDNSNLSGLDISHDGKTLIRIKKYDDSFRASGENIVSSSIKNTPREYVIMLLIDMGVNNKAHRLNILDPKFNYFAVKEFKLAHGFFYVQEFGFK